MTTNPARHIVLLGPMGVGKSTVAARLGELTGRPVLDNDALLVAGEGRSADLIAAAEGRPSLHEIEIGVLRDALVATAPSVITAAGSTMDQGSLTDLLDGHFVVLLWCDPEVTRRRVADRRGAHAVRDLHVDDAVTRRRIERMRSIAHLEIDTGVTTVDDAAHRVVVSARCS